MTRGCPSWPNKDDGREQRSLERLHRGRFEASTEKA
jgi:hypothetical protein